MVTIETVQKDVDDLYHFRDHYFETYPIEKAGEKTNNLKKRLEMTIQMIDQLSGDLQKKAECLLLRGRALNVMPFYDKQVEDLLSKAIKLDPKLSQAWINLGECYWKKRDVESARNCFNGSLNHSKDKVSLRNLSMVTRQLSKGNNEEKLKSIEESIELAKEAIQLDITDGTSWFVLGNAYLSLFFIKDQDPNTLKLCLSAYKHAEKDVVTKSNPDLYYNRATLYHYQDDYESALNGYCRASNLDPTFKEPIIKERLLLKHLRHFSQLIANKGKIPVRKLQSMIDDLNQSMIRSQSLESVSLDQLKTGINEKETVVAKVVCSFNVDDALSFSFCVVDKQMTCVGVSVYNIAPGWGVKIGDTVTIPQPFLQQFNFTYKDEEFKFSCIRLESPRAMSVNGRQQNASSQMPLTLSVYAKSE